MFFDGFVAILRKVSPTLLLTTRLGALFSNHETKSIRPHALITSMLFSFIHFFFFSDRSSCVGVPVAFMSMCISYFSFSSDVLYSSRLWPFFL